LFLDAIVAVQQAICHQGMDSEWTSTLAGVLEAPAATSTCLRSLLEQHGWAGTQFVRPPNRALLLDQLRLQISETEQAASTVDEVADLPQRSSAAPRDLSQRSSIAPRGLAAEEEELTAALAAMTTVSSSSGSSNRGSNGSFGGGAAAPLTTTAVRGGSSGRTSQQNGNTSAVAASRGTEPNNRCGMSIGQTNRDSTTQRLMAAGIADDIDTSNPQEVQEYSAEIYSKMFQNQVLYVPKANYMESQRDINGKMRAILVDWLVEVHQKYQLRIETLFLAVSLIDRYLARMPVMRGRLQLIGVVAMCVASKFEEMRPPDVNDFVYITDSAYTKEDILIMECQMLTTLGFHVAGPNVAHFLEILHRANGRDELARQVAQYAVELSLVELNMVRHTPSHLAAAAMLVSNEVLGRHPAWPTALAHQSRHGERALRSCAQELRALLRGAASTSLQAVRRKFGLPRHQSVAKMAF